MTYFLSIGHGGGQAAGSQGKGRREVYGRREKRGWEAGEIGGNYVTLRESSQSKEAQRGGSQQKIVQEPEFQGTGSGSERI